MTGQDKKNSFSPTKSEGILEFCEIFKAPKKTKIEYTHQAKIVWKAAKSDYDAFECIALYKTTVCRRAAMFPWLGHFFKQHV